MTQSRPVLFQKTDRLDQMPFADSIDQIKKIQIAQVMQEWPSSEIHSIDGYLHQVLSRIQLPSAKNGETVGVAVGSRGIDQLATVVRQCIDFLKSLGYSPVIIPAMGSHGGARDDGQRAVLASFGITEASMGAKIDASMDTIQIGELSPDFPVYFSRAAHDVDHLVVINRIKPHTKFQGPVESGLCKMMSIGLGKAKGAGIYHQKAVEHGFSWIPAIAQMVIDQYAVLFGLALIENQEGHLANITAVPKHEIVMREQTLLKTAKTLMPSIPFDCIDILMINEIGKNISGIGMDSNITGRHRDIVGDFYNHPHVKRIYVRSLSPQTNGNANGIGLADVIHASCLESIDFKSTYMNALTALSPEKAAIPLFFHTDKDCLAACLHTLGNPSPQSIRLVWIEHTKNLKKFFISEGLNSDLNNMNGVSQISDWETISFDAFGNINHMLNNNLPGY